MYHRDIRNIGFCSPSSRQKQQNFLKGFALYLKSTKHTILTWPFAPALMWSKEKKRLEVPPGSVWSPNCLRTRMGTENMASSQEQTIFSGAILSKFILIKSRIFACIHFTLLDRTYQNLSLKHLYIVSSLTGLNFFLKNCVRIFLHMHN